MYSSSSSTLPPARFLARTGAILAVAATLFVAACGGPSQVPPNETTTPTTSTACYTQSSELRFWMRDTVAVALKLPQNTTIADADISSGVLGAISPALAQAGLGSLTASGTGDQKGSPLVRSAQNAVAFFTLAPASSSSLSAVCDQRVIGAVDAINGLLQPGRGQKAASTVLKPVVVQVKGTDASGASKNAPVSILGASPDWIFGSSGDGGFAHPGSPPRLLPGSFDPTQAQDLAAAIPSLTASAADGSGTTVVVLDTGYQLGGSHTAPLRCGPDFCAPAPKPVTLSSTISAALSSQQFAPFSGLASAMQESDMQVTTDSADPGSGSSQPPAEFFDASGNPVNIVDHGLFISGLIHQAAPGAQIRLVRVLNDYGVGDLRSILTAVNTVANHPDQLGIDSSQHIVVNMSLSFGPSASCLVGTWRQWPNIQKGNAQQKQPYSYNCVGDQAKDDPSSLATGGPAGKVGVYAGLTLPLSVAISELANGSNDARARAKQAPITAVVAAAGNESKGVTPRLDADLPAGICGVVPVAALANAGSASPTEADFSNNPYISSNQCLDVSASGNSVTVALSAQTRPSVSAAGVNVCGIFLQDVPKAVFNGTTVTGGPTKPSDMALWDGTSFATGWASGYIARAGIPSGSTFTVPDAQKCNGLT